MTRNNKTYFYHRDSLGSITSLTDETGNIVQEYKYDSFGNITFMKDPSFIQPFTFTGREYDSESGLFHYRLRTYDSYTGTFISADPIGVNAGINLYSYVSNSPVNHVDPLGLTDKPIIKVEKYIGCDWCKKPSVIAEERGYMTMKDISAAFPAPAFMITFPQLYYISFTYSCVPSCCKYVGNTKLQGKGPLEKSYSLLFLSLFYDYTWEKYMSIYDCSACEGECKNCS